MKHLIVINDNLQKVLFVGLGGAGQRHLRIFRDLVSPDTDLIAYRAQQTTPTLNPDFSINESETLKEIYKLTLFPTLVEALDSGPDLVVVSNPTALHFDVCFEALKRGIGVFVEKPFSNNLNGYELIQQLVLSNRLPFMVSFQRRFHPLIRKTKDIISSGILGPIQNARFDISSYVPDWHPYEDFLNLYAVNKTLGGGVLLTEIHELDLCYWFFGLPESIYCIGGNLARNKLDVEDTAYLALRYDTHPVHISMCFMQQHNRRGFQISGHHGHLEWNQENNELILTDYRNGATKESTSPRFSNDSMFLAQAEYFLNVFDPYQDSLKYLDATWATQEMAMAAKQSLQSRKEEPVRSIPSPPDTSYS